MAKMVHHVCMYKEEPRKEQRADTFGMCLKRLKFRFCLNVTMLSNDLLMTARAPLKKSKYIWALLVLCKQTDEK